MQKFAKLETYRDIMMPNGDLSKAPMIKLFGIPMSNLCIFRVIHFICLDLLLRSNSYKKLLILVCRGDVVIFK